MATIMAIALIATTLIAASASSWEKFYEQEEASGRTRDAAKALVESWLDQSDIPGSYTTRAERADVQRQRGARRELPAWRLHGEPRLQRHGAAPRRCARGPPAVPRREMRVCL